ncbi:MAG: response regulator transcription factor [Tenacibaculum sp.]
MKDKLIVIIDDEADILEILSYNYSRERANVKTFSLGNEGLEFIKKNNPDAVICDWMLPDIDGIEICKTIKSNPKTSHIPFIMLTAKSDELYAVLALEMGADDYVLKPTRIKELISRTKKLIKAKKTPNKVRKTTAKESELENSTYLSQEETRESSIAFKDFVIDKEKYKIYINSKELQLTYSEFKLLYLFVNKPGKVFTRNQIIEKLNGLDYIVTERSIDVQVVGLRKKLGKYKDYLETVRGVGYRLKE